MLVPAPWHQRRVEDAFPREALRRRIAELEIGPPPAGATAASDAARAIVEGARVKFLSDLPPVENASGKGRLTGNSFKVVLDKGAEVSKETILEHCSRTFAKWQLPDDVIFVDQLPHTATGKILKTKLRSEYKEYKLPTV